MEIWGRTTSSNVQKVLWCCSELNLSYQRYDVGGEFGAYRTPEYLAINPNGLVPMILMAISSSGNRIQLCAT
jgi:glutathione S-transferase